MSPPPQAVTAAARAVMPNTFLIFISSTLLVKLLLETLFQPRWPWVLIVRINLWVKRPAPFLCGAHLHQSL
jgi:hypothetical protein